MTDIGRLAHVEQALSPLHVRAYFDEDLYAREQEVIFKRSPLYVGHEKAVPESGDWRRLPHEEGGRVLVRGADGVELISNVCRHRQSLILGGETGAVAGPGKPAGNLSATGGNIVCPLHRWTYDNRGQILGAPQFPSTPCLNLPRFPLKRCHGLLFEGPGDPLADLGDLFARPEFDFSDYVLDHVEVHQCNYNWKTFIEVYLEDYHVGPFHPGLGNFVTCDDLRWEFQKEYSVQTVGVASTFGKPGSDIYRKWHEVLLKYREGKMPERGAIWLTYYPHIMVEWYPHVLTVSTLHPVGVDKTLNMVEFYYPEEIVAFEREFVEAQRAAYMETCIEDDEIAERMDAGRKALWQRGDNEVGPYQSPMEDGMQHFHEWYRARLGDAVPRA
jgi:phenylpropionate dioxygenase-like ring-hydroxylating dioxygenase large terminal subunit